MEEPAAEAAAEPQPQTEAQDEAGSESDSDGMDEDEEDGTEELHIQIKEPEHDERQTRLWALKVVMQNVGVASDVLRLIQTVDPDVKGRKDTTLVGFAEDKRTVAIARILGKDETTRAVLDEGLNEVVGGCTMAFEACVWKVRTGDDEITLAVYDPRVANAYDSELFGGWAEIEEEEDTTRVLTLEAATGASTERSFTVLVRELGEFPTAPQEMTVALAVIESSVCEHLEREGFPARAAEAPTAYAASGPFPDAVDAACIPLKVDNTGRRNFFLGHNRTDVAAGEEVHTVPVRRVAARRTSRWKKASGLMGEHERCSGEAWKQVAAKPRHGRKVGGTHLTEALRLSQVVDLTLGVRAELAEAGELTPLCYAKVDGAIYVPYIVEQVRLPLCGAGAAPWRGRVAMTIRYMHSCVEGVAEDHVGGRCPRQLAARVSMADGAAKVMYNDTLTWQRREVGAYYACPMAAAWTVSRFGPRVAALGQVRMARCGKGGCMQTLSCGAELVLPRDMTERLLTVWKSKNLQPAGVRKGEAEIRHQRGGKERTPPAERAAGKRCAECGAGGLVMWKEGDGETETYYCMQHKTETAVETAVETRKRRRTLDAAMDRAAAGSTGGEADSSSAADGEASGAALPRRADGKGRGKDAQGSTPAQGGGRGTKFGAGALTKAVAILTERRAAEEALAKAAAEGAQAKAAAEEAAAHASDEDVDIADEGEPGEVPPTAAELERAVAAIESGGGEDAPMAEA